jgi:hypothetical protein
MIFESNRSSIALNSCAVLFFCYVASRNLQNSGSIRSRSLFCSLLDITHLIKVGFKVMAYSKILGSFFPRSKTHCFSYFWELLLELDALILSTRLDLSEGGPLPGLDRPDTCMLNKEVCSTYAS